MYFVVAREAMVCYSSPKKGDDIMSDKTETEAPSRRTEKESTRGKKDSTGELPMFDLQEAVTLVVNIHEKGLETAPMPQVAKGIGYASPSSTPFYRRFVAARLFGLLSATRAELTTRAKDYIRPESEDGKSRALIDAVMGVAPYAELVAKFQGKKLNVELVSNGLTRQFNLTDASAMICAKAFAASIRFAGLLSPDGIVVASGATPPEQPKLGLPSEIQPTRNEPTGVDMQQHTLFLDRDKTRKLVVSGPITISRGEYERICKWLEVVMIVEETKETATS
jgi:hypothetical protein